MHARFAAAAPRAGKFGGLGAPGPRGRSPVTGNPKYLSRTFRGTAADADEQLTRLVGEVAVVDHAGPPETFGAYLDRWLPKAAVLKDLSPRNPATRATPPAARQRVKMAPSPAEVQAMIATADNDDPDMATLIALAAVTGARRGELCGLRWGDVDFDRRTLVIERSVAVVDGQWITKGTKTHAGRVLALDDFADEVLRRQRRRHEDWAEELGVDLTDLTPILTYDLEKPIAPDTVTHYVRKIATATGVDTHLHALRHFAATQMIGGGHDIRTVAGRLGHKDASTTLKVYSHFLPERDRDAADFLGKALTSGTG